VEEPGAAESSDRIEILDVLRGTALLGMLLVNIDDVSGAVRTTESVHTAVSRFVQLLIAGKFVAVFTFLFGVGFALQADKAALGNRPLGATYTRRLACLLVLGWLHGLFLSSLDVLQVYALLGFLLLAFRHAAPRSILLAAVLCALIPTAWSAGRFVADRGPQTSSAEVTRARQEGQRLGAEQRRVSLRGTYGDMVAHRARVWSRRYRSPDWYAVELGEKFSLFLLGLYVGRRRIVRELTRHLPALRRSAWWALGVGLVALLVSQRRLLPIWLEPLLWIQAPALALFYTTRIALLHAREAWARRLRPLAAVGRMALTNYLLQSAICTTLFFGYGFGMYGRVGPATTALMAVAIFLLQVLWSVWWLRRFRFGPVEWLWRSATHWRLQPMLP
jgi:uncharacterized protein